MRRLLGGLPGWSLGFAVVLELMTLAAILYWPNFEKNIGAMRLLAGPIPALQDMVKEIQETGVVGYVAGQHFFKGCNTIGAAAAVLFAVGAVAGEAHRGTLEIWMARPYSRTRMLSERFVGGGLALAVPIFLTSATIPWLVTFVDEKVAMRSMLLSSVHQWVFLMTIYGVTFLASTRGSHPTRIALVVLFLTTFSFAVYMVKVVTHWSYFRLADIEDHVRIAQTGTLDWPVVLGLALGTCVLYLLSLWSFRRRLP